MPSTQFSNQGQGPDHHNQRESSRSTLSRFVGSRPSNSREQNLSSFAIVPPSNYQPQNLNQSHVRQQQQNNHHLQGQYQLPGPQEMYSIVPRASEVIPRAILNVADDLTEQIRISVQQTHISPRAYLNEYLTAGGVISDVHDEREGSVYYPTSAPNIGSENDQMHNMNLGFDVTTHPVHGNGFPIDQGSNNNHYSTNNDQQHRLASSVHVPNQILGLTNPRAPQPEQSTSVNSNVYLNNEMRTGEVSAASTSSSATTTTTSLARARPIRLIVICPTSNEACNNKQLPESSNIHSTESTRTLVSATAVSRIPTLRHKNQSNTSKGKSICSDDTQDEKRQECENYEESNEEVCKVGQISSSDAIDHIDDQELSQNSQQVETDTQYSIVGDIPPFSSHRQAGVLKTYLYCGSSFSGYQKSSKEKYEVNVKIQFIDFERSYLCGYLCINHLIQTHPSITTFFEGEIISEEHPFLTRKWQADEETDYAHWSKFEGFDGTLVRSLQARKFNYDRLKDSDYVYMRWKEQFLVPDYKVKEIFGASYDGFYYICYSKRTSQIKGYYFHQNTENFERFQSLHLEHDHQDSTQVYEFR